MSRADVLGSLPWHATPLIGWSVVKAASPKEGGDLLVAVFRDPTTAQIVCEQHNKTLEEGAPDGPQVL